MALLPAGCGKGGASPLDLPPAAVRCFTDTDRIQALAPAQDGSVWAGSPGGLLHFRPAGESWEVFSVADGLPANQILAVLVTARGEVWAGTAGGAARREGGRFCSFGAESGLPSPTVTSLAEGPDGVIWAGTLQGIARFDGKSWEAMNDSHEFARRAVRDIVRGADGSLWFAKENALTRWRGGRSWETYQRNVLDPDERMGLATNSLLSLAVDDGGVLLIGTKLGLQRFDGRAWSHEYYRGRLAVRPGLEDNWIEDVAAVPGGGVWVAHGESRAYAGGMGAAFRGGDGRWRYLTTADGLPSNLVHAVAAGPAGSVWLGTATGLARWDGRRVSSWRPPRTLSGNQATLLGPGEGGRLFALLPAGVVEIAGGEPREAAAPPQDGGFIAAALAGGALYLAPAAGGLQARRGDGTWSAEPFFAHRTVISLCGSSGGSLLAVTREGVFRKVTGSWLPLHTDGVPPGIRPLQALPDAAGNLWLAGERPSPAGGRLVLFRSRGGKFVALPVPLLLQGAPRLTHLLLDGAGAVWLAGPGGLHRFADGWREASLPFTRGSLQAAWVEGNGTIWAAGREGGLWRRGGDTWREVRPGGRPAPAGITSIRREGDGYLWLGSAGQGLLRLDPRQARPPF